MVIILRCFKSSMIHPYIHKFSLWLNVNKNYKILFDLLVQSILAFCIIWTNPNDDDTRLYGDTEMVPRNYFNVCLNIVLSQCIVYWILFKNIHTFPNQILHTLTSYTFLLVFKIVESLQCILNLSIYLSIYLSICLSIYLSIYLPT